jgi:DNA-binding CsgD family transcriptional regulator
MKLATAVALRLKSIMMMPMKSLIEILNLRQLPGVIILDSSGSLLFMNETVGSMVPTLPTTSDPGTYTVPAEIRAVCLEDQTTLVNGQSSSARIFYTAEGKPYSLRSFPLGGVAEQSGTRHIMVLVEPIIERHQVDFAAVKREYGISKRELEVLKLICQGLSNREIAARLFISEHTAKDHVRRILEAFGAASRSEVMAALNR